MKRIDGVRYLLCGSVNVSLALHDVTRGNVHCLVWNVLRVGNAWSTRMARVVADVVAVIGGAAVPQRWLL